MIETGKAKERCDAHVAGIVVCIKGGLYFVDPARDLPCGGVPPQAPQIVGMGV